jgi:hypothetical protein
LAAHAAENKHRVMWEEVKISENKHHYKERKIHEAAGMQIESNVFEQKENIYVRVSADPVQTMVRLKYTRTRIRDR